MLQDTVRTTHYHTAIISNSANMFKDKIVMDLGAGSGILSFFAVQAGAAYVYAVEASGMADRIRELVKDASKKKGARNPWLKDKIGVIQSKIEVPNLPISPVDTLVSEPIGVLLIHERMLESFLVARDRYLKPGGNIMPRSGSIYLAPFSDSNLWTQTMAKVRFWESNNFFGVDFGSLARDAKEEIFGQPIVGNFDYRILLSPSTRFLVDFATITLDEIRDFVIPISWTFPLTGLVHGIAGWFDIDIGGLNLSTAPNADRTHWQQVRFVLKEPLAVNAYETVTGWMRCKVNEQRSYTLEAELVVGPNPTLTNPYDPSVLSKSSSASRPQRFRPSGTGRRRGQWQLQEQTYWYTADSVDGGVALPEIHGMYAPDEDVLVATEDEDEDGGEEELDGEAEEIRLEEMGMDVSNGRL
ncbi:S-adenosyl-L-methionine-dependent methyltransferase [Cladochytrium replicatum]|nr:S-adenosyl-L-methionine-dependent methyltransferase [Cladochytrium replicatum]